MAFCTQRKFPGQCYEHNGLAEINKMRCYGSIKDHRAWSIDRNQQTSYLVDAVHKGEGTNVNSENTFSNEFVQSKDETEKTAKRAGTVVNVNDAGTSRSDSLKMFELSMELEETKLNNRTLKNENNGLRKRLANIVASSEHERDPNLQNHLQIIEEIISERNDLRELLDKFLGVTDQIIELKMQADHVRAIESDYILLQTKFRDHQVELETLRSEKKSAEERILELQTTNQETNSLKETNTQLEKDLFELSNMIAVSENYIHDQENEIETKLHTITELNKQIEGLKVALSEAEMKLNKKLRLEMDVELMEKELSIMIENSAESNSYNQQVIDRQVEDLATAIKLTLGCMNCEFENTEEENLVVANRQLKTLLLESSNKILEFKDVINKQEHNLMKVANDFACKNDELTECLATVEELKRQIANREATNNYKHTNTDSTNVQKIAIACTDDALIDAEQEIFQSEINLADSPPNSDCEDDGPAIEDLENIFEKSCIQQQRTDDTAPKDVKRSAKLSEEQKQVNNRKRINPDNERDVCEIPDVRPGVSDEFENVHHKLNDMTAEIDNLQKVNKELRETIRMLQQPIDRLKQSPSKSMSQLFNEAHREKLSTIRRSESVKEIENQNEKIKLENANLVAEISKLKHSEIGAQENISEMENELEKLKSIIETLVAEVNGKKFDNERDGLPAECKHSDVKQIEDENVNLKLENENLVAQIKLLKDSGNCTHMSVSEMKKELEKLCSINEQLSAELSEKKSERDLILAKEIGAMPPNLKDLMLKNEELRNDNEKLALKVRCLEQVETTSLPSDQNYNERNSEHKTEPDWLPSNEDLVAEIEKLQQSKSKSNLAIRQMEKDLKKMETINGNLLVQLTDKEAELKQFSARPNVDSILQQNEELKTLNGNLSAEISALKNVEAGVKEELENLAAINKTLMAEITELKQASEANTIQIEKGLLSQQGEAFSPKNSSQLSIMQIGKDLERLAAINESLLALNDTDVDKKHSLLDEMAPDINQLLKKNQELKNANENLSAKIRELQNLENEAQLEAAESKNRMETLAATNERLLAQIEELERFRSNDTRSTPSLHTLKNENEKLKSTNDKLTDRIALLEDKLHNIENRTTAYSSSCNEQQLSTSLPPVTDIADFSMEIDWMVADMKKLQNKNENLKVANEKLLSHISDLQSCANRSNALDEIKCDAEKVVDKKESDAQLIYASNRNIEIEWMKADMDVLQKKNEKLKSTNESLVAEVRDLKSAESRTHKSVQQMERDLLRLSAINERLSQQLNDKRLDKKQLSKENDASASESKDLLNKIDELTHSNECLASEIADLKSLDVVKMRNDLKRLSSTNESLKLQISELKLLSSNDLKMESDWMAADVKRLLNKNKKLNISNQNLLNDINELRREFKSLENRANVNALQKLKEMEKLTALNETLREQVQKNDKRTSKTHEIGLDALPGDVKKVQKKNDELKAANEKLLSVIINLKNSEKLATSKAAELEKELNRLQETNKNLQDTLENCVEKDWSKPKTELERICQLILNEGMSSLTDPELHYMHKWFCKTTSPRLENQKTSRKTTRKHCRICHQAVDPFDKTCDCKQYEEKKRLNLLKEIEETKLAIEHIQSSNDIEFDLNDVKNRLLKGKPPPTDQLNTEQKYEIRMSQSQGNVNVRAHIVTKPAKGGK